MERTSTDAFEVTANPCNHGNFCKGSSETVGIRLSKYSGGELTKLPPLQGLGTTHAATLRCGEGKGGVGAPCQGPGLCLAAFGRSLLEGL